MKRIAMKEVGGGVTAPKGFLAAGAHVGIKKQRALDLALLVSQREGPVAGVFTTNDVVAAPVSVDRMHLRRGRGRAVIVNSGNANACTGARGLRHAKEMAALVSRQLNVPLHTVFVGSTGVIGQPLPFPAIRRGIPRLVRRLRRGGDDAARAILTTDTKTKQVAVRAHIAGAQVTVGGMAKGAGMVHPNMATLLAYLTTDAAITRAALQHALRTAVDRSLNCVSVDGDTSTNDMVLCLANGLAGNRLLRAGTAAFAAFQRVLDYVCEELAKQLCRDAEGVTKVVRITVRGARTVAQAQQVARTVATSPLVKTALFGEDANWGRILAAVGRAGVRVDQGRLGLAFDGCPLVRRGVGLGARAERRVARVMRRKEFGIDIDLGLGHASAGVWTTDLSSEYVRINASYRT